MDPAYLHERLRYEPATGKLYWRADPALPDWWNTRYARTEAFTADNGSGYRVGKIDGVKLHAHRVVWAMRYGDWPEEIDHEDHDRSNNRIENLKDGSHTANLRNARRSKRNTSGVTGVTWDSLRGLWYASIKAGGRTKSLGRFTRFDSAVAARKAAEREYNFHPNHGTD